MNLSDLNNLNAENIGSWPLPVKIVGALLVFAIIGFLGWQYDIKDLKADLEKRQAQESKLFSSLEKKQRDWWLSPASSICGDSTRQESRTIGHRVAKRQPSALVSSAA